MLTVRFLIYSSVRTKSGPRSCRTRSHDDAPRSLANSVSSRVGRTRVSRACRVDRKQLLPPSGPRNQPLCNRPTRSPVHAGAGGVFVGSLNFRSWKFASCVFVLYFVRVPLFCAIIFSLWRTASRRPAPALCLRIRSFCFGNPELLYLLAFRKREKAIIHA